MRFFYYFRHVAESLKRSASYSENHREVGIIFASIVNFNELYDESYLGKDFISKKFNIHF